MIDRKIAQHHAGRLKVLPYFPEEDEAIAELLDAFETADSKSHVAGVATEFAQYAKKCPTPAEIREALQGSRPPAPKPEWEKQPKPIFKCPCDGWGTVGKRCEQIFCDCPIGRSLMRDVITLRVKPYEPTLYTPETFLAMLNQPPIVKDKRNMSLPGNAWLFGQRTERRARTKP